VVLLVSLVTRKLKNRNIKIMAAKARASNAKRVNESLNVLANYENMGTGIDSFESGGLKLTKQPVFVNKNLMVSAPGGFGNNGKYNFTDKTFQEGGHMRVGNGSLASISDEAYEVKGDNPNATDDVQVQNAFVDHGEVIKPDAQGLRIFSDHLKVPESANTFAKEAKKLEKSKSLKGKNNPAQDALIETKLKALFFKQQQLNGDNHGESTEEAIQPAGETPGAGFSSGNMFKRGGLSPINKPYHVITPQRIGINAPFGLGAEVMNFHKGGTLGEAVFEHAGFAKELKTEPGHGAGAATFQLGGRKRVNAPTAVAFPGYGKVWKPPVNEAGLKWGNRGPDLSFLDNTTMSTATAVPEIQSSGLRGGNRTKAPLTLNWGSENLFVPGQFSVEGQANQALAKMNPEAAATPPGNGKKSKIDWNNLAGIAGALGPNLANMALLKNTPEVAEVNLTQAPRLKKLDYSDQIAALKEGFRAANVASGRNTVMGQAKDSAAAANLAEYNRGLNAMYGDVNRVNTGISNEEAQLGWKNSLMNNQLLNQYAKDQQARGASILSGYSSILSDTGNKIQGLAAQSEQKKLDQQKLRMQREFYNKIAPGLYSRNPVVFGEEPAEFLTGGKKPLSYKMGGRLKSKAPRYRKAC
jgi:hypothetical protein